MRMPTLSCVEQQTFSSCTGPWSAQILHKSMGCASQEPEGQMFVPTLAQMETILLLIVSYKTNISQSVR